MIEAIKLVSLPDLKPCELMVVMLKAIGVKKFYVVLCMEKSGGRAFILPTNMATQHQYVENFKSFKTYNSRIRW